jgi:hypothetical protein
VIGDIYIRDLPFDVTEDVLYDHLRTLTRLDGTLSVINNAFLTSLAFFRHLVQVKSIVIVDNPQLVDARLPSLVDEPSMLNIDRNSRLCPLRWPSIPVDPLSPDEDDSCAHLKLVYLLALSGAFSETMSLTPLAGAFTTAIQSISSDVSVNFAFIFLSHITLVERNCQR